MCEIKCIKISVCRVQTCVVYKLQVYLRVMLDAYRQKGYFRVFDAYFADDI